jgi:hypothetical protein
MRLEGLLTGLEQRLDLMLLGAGLDTLKGQLSLDLGFFDGMEGYQNELLRIASRVNLRHRVLLGRLLACRSDRGGVRRRLLVSFYTPVPLAPLEILVCAQLLRGEGGSCAWRNHTGARLRVSEEDFRSREDNGVYFKMDGVPGSGRWEQITVVEPKDEPGSEFLAVDKAEGRRSPDLRQYWEAVDPIKGLPILYQRQVLERVMVPVIEFTVGGKGYRTSPIYVRNTGREGLGVFAAQDLEGGAVVTMYFGKMINPATGRGDLGTRGSSHYKALSIFGSAFAPGSVSGSCMDGAIQPEEGLTLEGYVTRSSVGSLMNSCEERDANCIMECSPKRCDKECRYAPYDNALEPRPEERVFCLLMKVKVGRPVRAGTQLRWHYRFDPHPSDAPYMNVDDGLPRV